MNKSLATDACCISIIQPYLSWQHGMAIWILFLKLISCVSVLFLIQVASMDHCMEKKYICFCVVPFLWTLVPRGHSYHLIYMCIGHKLLNAIQIWVYCALLSIILCTCLIKPWNDIQYLRLLESHWVLFYMHVICLDNQLSFSFRT